MKTFKLFGLTFCEKTKNYWENESGFAIGVFEYNRGGCGIEFYFRWGETGTYVNELPGYLEFDINNKTITNEEANKLNTNNKVLDYFLEVKRIINNRSQSLEKEIKIVNNAVKSLSNLDKYEILK